MICTEILDPPLNVTVGLGHSPLVLPCTIRGESIFWLVNGDPLHSTNIELFMERGITFTNPVFVGTDMVTSNATVAVTNITNTTELICEAVSDNEVEASNPAIIFITGLIIINYE